jgi:hypothetical protein
VTRRLLAALVAACVAATAGCERADRAEGGRVVPDSEIVLRYHQLADSADSAASRDSLRSDTIGAARAEPAPAAPATPAAPAPRNSAADREAEPEAESRSEEAEPRPEREPGREASGPPAPGGALIVEDFSRYRTIADFRRTRPEGRWRNEGMGSDRMVLDRSEGFRGAPHALRYDFPGGAGNARRCDDFSIGRDLYLPEPQREIWVEAWVKFSPNWHTKPPESWRCSRSPDHKLLRGYVHTPDPTYTFFQVKDGKFGHTWSSSAPSPKHWDLNLKHPSAPYWNGQWVRVRVHWRVGRWPRYGAVRLWIGDRLIDDNRRLETQATGIYMLRLGANMNNLVEQPQSLWWGRVSVWNRDPGW